MSTLEGAHAQIVAGEPIVFHPSRPEEQRTIPAEWIQSAGRAGVRIEIGNAVVTGSLDLKYTTFLEVVSLVNCRFIQGVDFPYSVFERFLDVSGSVFEQGIIFKGGLLKRGVSLDRLQVDAGEVNFTDIQVCGLLTAKEASFGRKVTVTFSRARFEKSVQFQRARFMCKAVFSDIVIGPEAVFGGVVFEEEADFGRAQFLGETLFRGDHAGGLDSAIFKKRADFTAAQFGGHAAFDGVTFSDKAIFNGVKFRGAALFRSNPNRKLAHSTFEKAADFTAIEVESYADFTDAQFKGEALFSGAKVEGGLIFKSANFAKGAAAHFYGARVRQQSYFEDTVFEDQADFREVQFGASTFFCGSVFNEIALFESANFAGLADFSTRHHGVKKNTKKGAVFHDVNFDYARFEGDARLEDVEFLGSVSLRETSFRGVKFSVTGSVATGQEQFGALVEMGGCPYDRIEVDWRTLLKRLPSASYPDRYDRQPYVQLEKVLRASGSDEGADTVYLERRRVERMRKKWLPKAWGVFWWGLAHYGVRPYRLIVFATVLIVSGSVVFHRPGAVEPKTPGPPDSYHSGQKGNAPRCPNVLTIAESVRFSLRNFLPVELPLLEDCRASPGYCSDFAALLKVFGWIIVPVGVAALAGLLRRGPPPARAE